VDTFNCRWTVGMYRLSVVNCIIRRYFEESFLHRIQRDFLFSSCFKFVKKKMILVSNATLDKND